jgi:hypothetical protein
MEPNDARIATETGMRPARSAALGAEFQTTGMGRVKRMIFSATTADPKAQFVARRVTVRPMHQ